MKKQMIHGSIVTMIICLYGSCPATYRCVLINLPDLLVSNLIMACFSITTVWFLTDPEHSFHGAWILIFSCGTI